MWESNFILLGGIALPLFTFLEVIKLVNKHKVNLTQAAVSDADYNNSITSQMVHFEKKKKEKGCGFWQFSSCASVVLFYPLSLLILTCMWIPPLFKSKKSEYRQPLLGYLF